MAIPCENVAGQDGALYPDIYSADPNKVPASLDCQLINKALEHSDVGHGKHVLLAHVLP